MCGEGRAYALHKRRRGASAEVGIRTSELRTFPSMSMPSTPMLSALSSSPSFPEMIIVRGCFACEDGWKN